MIFSNYKKVATGAARSQLLRLVDVAMRSVQPKYFIPAAVSLQKDILTVKGKKFSISKKRIFVIGAGKAVAEMALEIEKILGAKRITAGIVLTNKTNIRLKKIAVHLADHPLPSNRGWAGAKKIFNLKKQYAIDENDLIIALVSGGGSALMPHPVPGISLKDKKRVYDLFIKYGVEGKDSTIIKSKISRVKGGGLARHFFPTPIISLVLSDDNGKSGDEFTSSGPFTNHPSTVADSLAVIDKYKMRPAVPKSVMAYLQKNIKIQAAKPTSHVSQFILADNTRLVGEIGRLGEKNGWRVIMKVRVAGEAKAVAREFCKHIAVGKLKKPSLMVWGGETTVRLPKKHGRGGRNQEFVAAALNFLKGYSLPRPWALASVATDGVDYISQSAGGIIDGNSWRAVEKKKIDVDMVLKKHDSSRLLELINSSLVARHSTGTNVGDLMMYFQL